MSTEPRAGRVTFATLLQEAAAAGRRLHAGWDQACFDGFAIHARALWEATSSPALLRAYLAAVREGIAAGLLRSPDPACPTSLLDVCLAGHAPAELAGVTAEQAAARLAAAWNLAAGLAAEPAWMQGYVLSRRAELAGLAELRSFLLRVLPPVLAVPVDAAFDRDLAVTVLDTRAVDDEFLPGTLRLVAPTVLAVADRRRPVTLGVALRHDRRSELLGPIDELAAYAGTPGPPARVSSSTLEIAGSRVELPLLVSPLAHAVAAAGFVAVTAVDSQRLWIVEGR